MTTPLSIRQTVDGFAPLKRLFTEDTELPPSTRPPVSSIGESAQEMKPILVAFEKPVRAYLATYRDFQADLATKLASAPAPLGLPAPVSASASAGAGHVPVPSGGLPPAPAAGPGSSIANIQRLNDLLDREYTLVTDRTAWVSNEHDVVAESAKHLLHPLNQHLSLIAAVLSDDLPVGHRPFEVRTLGESPVKAESVLLVKPNGDPVYLSGRPDMVLVRTELGQRPIKPTNDGAADEFNARSFAVFEVKNLHVLDRKRLKTFIKPTVGRNSASRRQWLVKARKIGRVGYVRSPTAKALLKQAILYAILERVKHVALYDNKTLLLLKFSAMKINSDTKVQHLEKAKVGEWCEATLIPFDEPIPGHGTQTGRELAMQALLGFYIEAIEETPRDKRAGGTVGI